MVALTIVSALFWGAPLVMFVAIAAPALVFPSYRRDLTRFLVGS